MSKSSWFIRVEKFILESMFFLDVWKGKKLFLENLKKTVVCSFFEYANRLQLFFFIFFLYYIFSLINLFLKKSARLISELQPFPDPHCLPEQNKELARRQWYSTKFSKIVELKNTKNVQNIICQWVTKLVFCGSWMEIRYHSSIKESNTRDHSQVVKEASFLNKRDLSESTRKTAG